MPFKSKAQQRFMFAAEAAGELPAGTAKQWAHETDNIKQLPERVRGKKPKKKKDDPMVTKTAGGAPVPKASAIDPRMGAPTTVPPIPRKPIVPTPPQRAALTPTLPIPRKPKVPTPPQRAALTSPTPVTPTPAQARPHPQVLSPGAAPTVGATTAGPPATDKPKPSAFSGLFGSIGDLYGRGEKLFGQRGMGLMGGAGIMGLLWLLSRMFGKQAADLSTGTAARKRVPKGEFAYTGRSPKGESKAAAKGKYPMPDAAHARAALGFAAMHHGKDSAEYRRVHAKAQSLGYAKQAGLLDLPRERVLPGVVAGMIGARAAGSAPLVAIINAIARGNAAPEGQRLAEGLRGGVTGGSTMLGAGLGGALGGLLPVALPESTPPVARALLTVLTGGAGLLGGGYLGNRASNWLVGTPKKSPEKVSDKPSQVHQAIKAALDNTTSTIGQSANKRQVGPDVRRGKGRYACRRRMTSEQSAA